MALFSLKAEHEVFGALIEVGSGSVLVALVHSDPQRSYPTIVWSHREHAPLKNIDSLEQSAKAVMTALMNAVILLDTTGRQALNEYREGAQVSRMQASVSAPWSYTVTKTINYEQGDAFTVSTELVEDLIRTAEKQIEDELRTNESASNLGLTIITEATLETRANGYQVSNPEGNEANTLSVTRASVVAQEYLTAALGEQRDKVFPGAKLRQLSFILMMYSMSTDLLPVGNDWCLVDVTYEATEIGIVRDGSLQYCTHTPFGSFSLAREISSITKVPLHESFSYLHTEKPYAFMEKLNKGQSAEVEALFEAYTERLHKLFLETGDSLSIPKHIAIHADLKSEPFFKDIIEKAAKRSLKSAPHITLMSREIIRQTRDQQAPEQSVDDWDTAALLSALFFHTHRDSLAFEYQ